MLWSCCLLFEFFTCLIVLSVCCFIDCLCSLRLSLFCWVLKLLGLCVWVCYVVLLWLVVGVRLGVLFDALVLGLYA